jgi:hypothetical protein
VLHVGTLGPVGVDRQLHVPALLGLRLEPGEHGREVVGPARVEARFRTAAAVVVLTDEDVVVLEDHLVPGGRMHLERHIGEQGPLVVTVEVDLEHAPDMRLVVGVVVEFGAVDLDRAVVPGRVGGRLAGDGPDKEESPRHHADEADQCAPSRAVVHHVVHLRRTPFSHGLQCPMSPLQRDRGRRAVSP